jgi:protein TonB
MRTFRFQTGYLDETLFENRNKEYGAYELRKSYPARVIKSLLLTLASIGLLVSVPLLLEALFKSTSTDPVIFSTPVELGKKFVVEQKKSTVSILRPEPSPKIKVHQNGVYQVLKDSLAKAEPSKNDTIQKTAVTTAFTNILNNGSVSGDSIGSGKEKNHSPSGTPALAFAETYSIATVEKVPEFTGGENALMDFLRENIRYNEAAKEEKVRGRVYASFVINSKGEVEAIKILRGLGYGLDDEVMRVLNLMPKWEPGYFRGKAVSTVFNLPVTFSIIQ